MRIGFYAGSFDPPTLGHIDIITRAATLVDKLIVGIGVHATKQAMFTPAERATMIEKECKVEVVNFDNLLVDAARKHKASLIIRGLRSAADFDYEAQMTAMNHKMANDIETIFLAATPEYDFISSTLVRQIAAMGGDVSAFVSPAIAKAIKTKV